MDEQKYELDETLVAFGNKVHEATFFHCFEFLNDLISKDISLVSVEMFRFFYCFCLYFVDVYVCVGSVL